VHCLNHNVFDIGLMRFWGFRIIREAFSFLSGSLLILTSTF